MKTMKSAFGKLPGIFYGMAMIFLFFAFVAPGFVSKFNILALSKDCCLLIIISLGMHMTILSGKLDISVGAVMSFCGVVTALLLQAGVNMWVAILAGILLGACMGTLSGYLIAYQGFDFWVVTYAFMGIAQGLALVLSDGNTIPGFSENFRFFGTGKIFGIFVIIWITILISAFMVYLNFKTKFGYNVYSVGGSPSSAQLSGINVRRVCLSVFAISGIMSAVSGILLAAKSNSASPIGGSGYEFDAIAAVLIGGTPFCGGVGRITHTIMGAILMRMLRNGLNLVGLSPYWQTFIIGAIVMLVIIVDVLHQRRKSEQAERRVYLLET